jgi:hypothetical protein
VDTRQRGANFSLFLEGEEQQKTKICEGTFIAKHSQQ